MLHGLWIVLLVCAYGMPLPFTRELRMSDSVMRGNDVIIAQTLLNRNNAVTPSVPITGNYDLATTVGVSQFQVATGLNDSKALDENTAVKLLSLHSDDGFKDSGFTAASMGYMYKIHIPVYHNRSIETYATLFDKDNNVMLKFRVRTHGKAENGDFGRNQFSNNGNTVTGMAEIDLNSPEPNTKSFGPYPINRFVKGLDGNAKFLLPNIRDGILIHTGEWDNWNPSKDMPNSNGCVHGHPEDIKKIHELLVGIGVRVNDNPFTGVDYPYRPQGLVVVELLDKQIL
jgi:hypothetical protein